MKAPITAGDARRGAGMAGALVTGAALLAGILQMPAAFACGYEDPSSVSIQRGMMNLVYPNALHVLGAVTLARMNSALFDKPVSPPHRDLFGNAFRRAAEDLVKLGEALAGPDKVSVSAVLLEPMLWTRYSAEAGKTSTEVHARGPLPGSPVLVTSEVVLHQVVAGRLSWQTAEEMGLVRFYGDANAVQRIKARLKRGW